MAKLVLKVSRICLGTMTYGSKQWRAWNLDEEESRPFIFRALELGINFFDTADMYSLGLSEEILGRAIKDSKVSREDIVIATKVYMPMTDSPNQRGLSAKHIIHSVDNSLRRLQANYIDLYQIHRFDFATPIEETLIALHRLVEMGKILYLGASSMPAWRFAKMLYTADKHGLTRFASMQNHYNVIYREEEREMIPLCLEEGVGVIPYSPLARGFVAGNRRQEDTAETLRAKTDDYTKRLYTQESDFTMVEKLSEIAARCNLSNAKIALAWLLNQRGVTSPIIGASKMQHLEDAVDALEIKLSPEELTILSQSYQSHSVLNL